MYLERKKMCTHEIAPSARESMINQWNAKGANGKGRAGGSKGQGYREAGSSGRPEGTQKVTQEGKEWSGGTWGGHWRCEYRPQWECVCEILRVCPLQVQSPPAGTSQVCSEAAGGQCHCVSGKGQAGQGDTEWRILVNLGRFRQEISCFKIQCDHALASTGNQTSPSQRSPNFLAPGTSFVEGNFSRLESGDGFGMILIRSAQPRFLKLAGHSRVHTPKRTECCCWSDRRQSSGSNERRWGAAVNTDEALLAYHSPCGPVPNKSQTSSGLWHSGWGLVFHQTVGLWG